MDNLQPQSLGDLQGLLQENARTGQWQGLIFTGSEITLQRELPVWVRQAKAHGFQHVRIQSHGMKLADAAYCAELIEAGVDEFFISMPAADAASHDAITGVVGSYAKTLQGLANLEQYPHVAVLTNTVVTQLSYQQLPAIVEQLRSFKRLLQMEFWLYWPMREHDDKDLIASHLQVLPYLIEASEAALAQQRGVEIKNFPQCLLGNLQHLLHNDQPQLLIDPEFWQQFMRNGFYQCQHREQCSSKQCLGLNSAYVEKFGWHAQQLQPL